jgi:nucleoside-diphosphate-sugar epimerase
MMSDKSYSFVMGPPLVLPESPEELSMTTNVIWKILAGGEILPLSEPTAFPTHIDVRDVARIHLWAVEHCRKADGQRYMTIAGLQSNQAVADILRRQYPNRRNIIREGNPGQGYPRDFQYPKGGIEFDSTKAVKATGQDWIKFEQTVIDAAKAFEYYL